MLESFQRLINAGFTRLPVMNRFQRGDLIVERGRSGDWYWTVGNGVLEPVPYCDDPVAWIINDE